MCKDWEKYKKKQKILDNLMLSSSMLFDNKCLQLFEVLCILYLKFMTLNYVSDLLFIM